MCENKDTVDSTPAGRPATQEDSGDFGAAGLGPTCWEPVGSRGRGWEGGVGAHLKKQRLGVGGGCVCARALVSFSFLLLFFWTGEAIYCTESDVWMYFFCLHHFLKINMKL